MTSVHHRSGYNGYRRVRPGGHLISGLQALALCLPILILNTILAANGVLGAGAVGGAIGGTVALTLIAAVRGSSRSSDDH